MAGVAGVSQAWDDFSSRFGLPFAHGDIGYGHTSEEVSAVRIPDPSVLVDVPRGRAPADARRISPG